MSDKTPAVWAHRKEGHIFSMVIELPAKTFGINRAIYYRTQLGHVTEMCLGERYVHSAPGVYFEHEVWQGSYIDNWHGGIQTESLREAAEWVAQAEQPDLLYHFWMKKNE